MKDEGVIKFKCSLKPNTALIESEYIEVEKWRAILYKMSLIGEYPMEKLGYGNLSKRTLMDQFIITGTQTGKYANLNGSQYTKVIKCDLKKMKVEAIGPIAPSSESLTHFAIYKSCKQINYIFHVHHQNLWSFMLNNNYDKTSKGIDYGTQEMALEASHLIGNNKKGIFAMQGHEDGIIAYADTSENCGKLILDTLKQLKLKLR